MILDFTAREIADTIDSFNNPNKRALGEYRKGNHQIKPIL